MSYLEDMIAKCDDMIADPGTAKEVDALAREIISAYRKKIPNIGNYRGAKISGMAGSGLHTVDGIVLLRAKLLCLKDETDAAIAEKYGTGVIDSYISKCKAMIAQDKIDDNEARILVQTIAEAYEPEIPKIKNSFNCFNGTYIGFDLKIDYKQELLSALGILEAHKDKVIRDVNMAEKGGITLNNSNSQYAPININITLEQTFGLIDAIDEAELSEDEKATLKGLVATVEHSSGREKKGEAAKKVIMWLADKSVDVIIAAVPIVGKALFGI